MENYNNDNLIAIIGDIIDSKKIDENNRRVLQSKLSSTLSEINEEYKEDIVSNFIITLGDEFQGILNKSQYLFEIIEKIQFNISDVQFRFGIGIGKIYTDINREASIGFDGPAYHKARKSISILKNNKNFQNIYIESSDIVFDEELNAHLFWVCNCFNNWSPLQKKIVKLKIKDYNIIQAKISDILHIDQSLVSRSIKASNFENYNLSKKSIIKLLETKRFNLL